MGWPWRATNRSTPLDTLTPLRFHPLHPEAAVTAAENSYDAIILFGVVKDTNDPDGLGRVQCDLVGFGETVTLPFLRVLQPTASNAFGHFFLPEIGDEVVILRGAGNEPAGMVIIGSLYHGKNKPVVKEDGKNNTKEIFTRGGNRITISDEDGKESILIYTKEEKVSILLDAADSKLVGVAEEKIDWKTKDWLLTAEKTVTIKCADGDVLIQASTATVKAKEIVAQGDTIDVKGGKVNVTGDAVTIKPSGDGKFQAGGNLTLKGAKVLIG